MPEPPDETSLRVTEETTQDGQDDRETQSIAQGKEEDNYPHGIKLISIFAGLFLACLCVGLVSTLSKFAPHILPLGEEESSNNLFKDRSIIATAIPKITNEFNSLPDVAWYGSAYLLTSCCFQLMFGKLYAEFGLKWTFLSALSIFEVGSILCAAAPNSPALIVGRAIAGLGAAGVAIGALTILAAISPLKDRPKYTGAIGAAMGVAQVVGPTLGGVFADHVTWRWCFWINLPLGGVTLVTVALFLNVPAKAKPSGPATFMQVLQKFDLLGTVFLLPAITCLLLALEWGGSYYPWNSWRVILLLCIFAVCIAIWGFVQVRQGDKATVPMRIVTQRSIACALWYMFCLMGQLFTLIYYVPIWFQAVLNTSAQQSGINNLANTIATALMSISAGFITSKIGYYVPLMIVGTVLSSVATGLIYRFGLVTSTGYWIGSLILLGLGVGAGGQQSLMVPQTMLTGGDIALGTSAMVFVQTVSGTIFLSVAGNVFQDCLRAELRARVPSVAPSVVISSGASELKAHMSKIYPDNLVEGILGSYAVALQRVFLISVVLACLSVFGSALCEWKSVKKDYNAPSQEKGVEEGAEKK